MIVLEIKFYENASENLEMDSHVLAVGNDEESVTDRKIFESEIIPNSYATIEKVYGGKTLNDNPNLCVDMMNVLVRYAKQFSYRLDRLGQNKNYSDQYQLKFIKETDERFMGSDKEICDAI